MENYIRTLMKHDYVFSVGIEEEFQIIDPETRELRSHIQQILADGKLILKEQVKPGCTSRPWNWALRFAATRVMLRVYRLTIRTRLNSTNE